MRRALTFLFWLTVGAACFYFSWQYYDNRGRDEVSTLVAVSESPDARSHLAHTWRLDNPSGGRRRGRISIVVRSRQGPNTEDERSEYGPRPLESHEGDDEFVVGSVEVGRDVPAEVTTELLDVHAKGDAKFEGKPLRLRVELKSGDEAVSLTGDNMNLAGDTYHMVSSTTNRGWKSGELDLYKVMTVNENRLWICDVFLRRDE